MRSFIATRLLFLLTSTCWVVRTLGDAGNSGVSRLLREWSDKYPLRRQLLIIIDEKTREDIQVPRALLESSTMATRILSLGVVEKIRPGNCVLLLVLDLRSVDQILQSPHLTSFWQPENLYILRQIPSKQARATKISYRGDPSEKSAMKEGLCVMDETEAVKDILEERKNFNGYPLKISIFSSATMTKTNNTYHGVDHLFLQEFCRMMNVTPILRENPKKYGWNQNGVFVGTMGDIIYRKTDLTFNQFFIKKYGSEELQSTTFITGDELCVAVPKALPLPEYLLLIRAFNGSSWLLIISSQFIISFVYTSMRTGRKALNSPQYQRNFKEPGKSGRGHKGSVQRAGSCKKYFLTADCFPYPNWDPSNIWRTIPNRLRRNVVVGLRKTSEIRSRFLRKDCGIWNYCPNRRDNGEKRLNGRSCFTRWTGSKTFFTDVFLQLFLPLQQAQGHFSERMVLTCSLILAIVLTGTFTSKLTSNFSSSAYYKDINALEELDASGMSILTSSPDLLSDTFPETPKFQSLRSKLAIDEESDILRRLSVERNAGFLLRREIIVMPQYHDFIDKMYIMEECPKYYLLGFLAQRGSPFLPRINTIIERLNSGGIYIKWVQKMVDDALRIQYHKEKTSRDKISMKHVSIPFVILFIGLFASFFVFSYELYTLRSVTKEHDFFNK
ncbi:uncharacterized protein [Prorops nasuta]|uniref:uncharacterized protein isoform X2 n=1 Tax=Prorops nasuta TaxID=863751 RepID=UPI0034CD660F